MRENVPNEGGTGREGGERRERGEDKKEKKSLGKYPAAHSI